MGCAAGATPEQRAPGRASHVHKLCLLQQDSISQRLRRSTSEERGGSSVTVSAPPPGSLPEAAKGGAGGSGAASDDGDVMYVTAKGAVAYLFVASAVLVALFFLLDYINTLIVS